VQLDLLWHDLDRTRQLITTFFTQHTHLCGTLATHRAHHHIILSSRRHHGSLLVESLPIDHAVICLIHEQSPYALRLRSHDAVGSTWQMLQDP
jgi:hypothetical protein